MNLRDPRWKTADELPNVQEGRLLRETTSLLKNIIASQMAWIEYRRYKKPELFQGFMTAIQSVVNDFRDIGVALRMDLTPFRACQAAIAQPTNPAQQAAYSRISLGLGGARAAAADMIQSVRDLGDAPTADLSLYGADFIGVVESFVPVVRALRLDIKPFNRVLADLSGYFQNVSDTLVDMAPSGGEIEDVPFENIRLAKRIVHRFLSARSA
jgi:hypothetical protein